MARQIFARKSINKLIAESERPEHALRKTLGPVSLTALGIGAVIGSGIFTVIGTAIAGDMSTTTELLRTPVINYILHHSALAGRPGAGPALALSLVLVAIVCGLTGLCYAELASMIPIAAPPTPTPYATLGELIAWIIGWDLISSMPSATCPSPSVLPRTSSTLMDWCGLHFNPRWISPAYLRSACRTCKAATSIPRLHFGFNIPAFIIVMLLTVLLVRGHPRIHPRQQRHGPGQDRRHTSFSLLGIGFITRGTTTPSRPTAGPASSPALHHLLHLHRLRLPSPPPPKSARTRSATSPSASSQPSSSAPSSTLE